MHSPRPRSSLSQPRSITKISESLHSRLNGYALAASAAGVAVLALSRPAQARVIYTPANIGIAQNGMVQIDFTHDGTYDFALYSDYTGVSSWERSARLIIQKQKHTNNEVWQSVSGMSSFAAALPKNFEVGSNQAFRPFSSIYLGWVGRDYERFFGNGPWRRSQESYLGLRFSVNGKIHYGWARLKVATALDGPMPRLMSAVLTGYAYETIPNKPIVTGKTKRLDAVTVYPAALGALAAGSAARSTWRQKESSQ